MVVVEGLVVAEGEGVGGGSGRICFQSVSEVLLGRPAGLRNLSGRPAALPPELAPP